MSFKQRHFDGRDNRHRRDDNRQRVHFALTDHARERMEERNITEQQIAEIIRQWNLGDVLDIQDGKSIHKLRSSDSITVILKKSPTVGKPYRIVTVYNQDSAFQSDIEMASWKKLYDEILHPTLNTRESLRDFVSAIRLEIKDHLKTHNSEIANDENIFSEYFQSFLNFSDVVFLSGQPCINHDPSVNLLALCILCGNVLMLDVLLLDFSVYFTEIPVQQVVSHHRKPTLHKVIAALDSIDHLVVESIAKENVLSIFQYLLDHPDLLLPHGASFLDIVRQRSLETPSKKAIQKNPQLHAPHNADRIYTYSLLHRALWDGFDKMAVWLINHAELDFSDEVHNLTRHDETISDLIRCKYSALPLTINYLKEIKGVVISKTKNKRRGVESKVQVDDLHQGSDEETAEENES